MKTHTYPLCLAGLIGATASCTVQDPGPMSDRNATDDTYVVDAVATQDTYVREANADLQSGDQITIQVKRTGANRALVGFNAADLEALIAGGDVVSATLELDVDMTNHIPAGGEELEVYAMNTAWTEDATWNCSDDMGPGNSADCSDPWDMSAGGAFASAASGTAIVEKKQSAPVSFDVTADFANGAPAHGWLIKKTDEEAKGFVKFISTEGGSGARLTIEVAPPTCATDLSAGDIAIVGYNFDNPDEFAFVALTNIGAGAQIKFTDNGWKAIGEFRDTEGTYTWTTSTGVDAGEVITLTNPGLFFSTSGDQILAYQGDDSAPNFLYALHSNGGTWQSDATSSTTSAIPTGLVDGVTAVSIPEIDNARYNGGTSGDAASLLASISDDSNWGGSNSTRQTMPAGPFDVQGVDACVQNAPALLITEYVEGSSNNKAIELTNVGNAPADLDALGAAVSVYFNGNTSAGAVVNLSGVIAPGEQFVLADNNAAGAVLAVADQITSSSLWNGDDAIVLTVNGDVADSLGQVGTDPGSYWGTTSTVKTQNQTLRRDASVTAGDTDPSDAFDPADEWIEFAQDDFSGLGN
jgi:hypothetical protein